MAPPSPLVSKLKVQLKLAISRLRMTQQKDTAISKQQRRSMAQLLEQGKMESAKIRVENIIRSDITTELYEILELYCELVLARSQLLDVSSPTSSPSLSASSAGKSGTGVVSGPDPALAEGVRAIVYAALHTEIKELHVARALLVDKFGKEFAVSAMEGEGVPERVLKRLRVDTPKPELVDAYLREIARAYGVPLAGDDEEEEEVEDEGYAEETKHQANDDDDDDDDDDDGEGGGQRVEQSTRNQKYRNVEQPLRTNLNNPRDTTDSSSEPDPNPQASKKEDDVRALSQATPPRNLGPRSPLRVMPPSPSTENVAPKIRMPGGAGSIPTKKTSTKPKTGATTGGGGSSSAAAASGGNAGAARSANGGAAGAAAAAAAKDSGPGGKIPDVDELAKRFAALKRM